MVTSLNLLYLYKRFTTNHHTTMNRTDFLNGGNFDFLKEDATLRSHLKVNDNLSFSMPKANWSERMRIDLDTVKVLTDAAVHTLLDKCTITQIEAVKRAYNGSNWNDPETATLSLQLEGITLDKNYWLHFVNDNQETVAYRVKDLLIEDAIYFLETIEKVLQPVNTLKS